MLTSAARMEATGTGTRLQSGQIHHVTAVRVAKVLARLVQGPVVVRASMTVNHEDPSEPLLAKLSRKIHEYRPQRGGADRVRPGKDILPTDPVRPIRSQRDDRKYDRRPPGPLRDCGREILGQAFVQVTVGERRQIGAVLLQDSAGEEDHGSLPVEHANLIDIQLGESVDLGLSRA